MKTIFFLLLFAWILIASGRLLYNISKIITEEKAFILLPDDQKKENLYEDVFQIYKTIIIHAQKTDTVCLVSKDKKSYFLLRYLLYPQPLYWINSSEPTEKGNSNHCKIFTLYHKNDFTSSDPYIKDLNKMNSSFVTKTVQNKNNISFIYIKK